MAKPREWWKDIEVPSAGPMPVQGGTGFTGLGMDNRMQSSMRTGDVHEGEYVMDAPVVKALGQDILDKMREGVKTGNISVDRLRTALGMPSKQGFEEGGLFMPDVKKPVYDNPSFNAGANQTMAALVAPKAPTVAPIGPLSAPIAPSRPVYDNPSFDVNTQDSLLAPSPVAPTPSVRPMVAPIAPPPEYKPADVVNDVKKIPSIEDRAREQGLAGLGQIAAGNSKAIQTANNLAQRQIAASGRADEEALRQEMAQLGYSGGQIMSALGQLRSQTGSQMADAAAKTALGSQQLADQATSQLASQGLAGQQLEFAKQKYGDEEGSRMATDVKNGMTWETFSKKYPGATQEDYGKMFEISQQDYQLRKSSQDFLVKQYGDGEGQRMYSDIATGMTWETFSKKYPTATREDYDGISKKTNKTEVLGNYNELMSQYESALDEGEKTGDWSRAKAIWEQMANNPDFAGMMGVPPVWDNLKNTWNKKEYDNLQVDIGKLVEKYNTEPDGVPLDFVDDLIAESLKIRLGRDPSQAEIEQEYNTVKRIGGTEAQRAVYQFKSDVAQYFDTPLEQETASRAISEMISAKTLVYDEASKMFKTSTDSVLLPWNNPKYSHIFDAALSTDPEQIRKTYAMTNNIDPALVPDSVVESQLMYNQQTVRMRDDYVKLHSDADSKEFTGMGFTAWNKAMSDAKDLLLSGEWKTVDGGKYAGSTNFILDYVEGKGKAGTLDGKTVTLTSSGLTETVKKDESGLWDFVSGTTGMPLVETAPGVYSEQTYENWTKTETNPMGQENWDKVIYLAGHGDTGANTALKSYFGSKDNLSTMGDLLAKLQTSSPKTYQAIVSSIPAQATINGGNIAGTPEYDQLLNYNGQLSWVRVYTERADKDYPSADKGEIWRRKLEVTPIGGSMSYWHYDRDGKLLKSSQGDQIAESDNQVSTPSVSGYKVRIGDSPKGLGGRTY